MNNYKFFFIIYKLYRSCRKNTPKYTQAILPYKVLFNFLWGKKNGKIAQKSYFTYKVGHISINIYAYCIFFQMV